MEKQTVLAKLNSTIRFSEETHIWFRKLSNYPDIAWFAQRNGQRYLREFRSEWDSIFLDIARNEVNTLFIQYQVPQEARPRVQVVESYEGSWVIDAVIVMAGTAGKVYTTLKGIAELPKIADGIKELKERINKKYGEEIDKVVSIFLEEEAEKKELPPPPKSPTTTSLSIDARPLIALTPAKLRNHRININVGISKETIVLENLDNNSIRDIKIGIFKSKTQIHNWVYQESYQGTVSMLSGGQTITKDINEFTNISGEKLKLDELPLHVDCWIQDIKGIYIFNFYLEDE